MGATEVISLRCDGDRLVVELDPNAGARDGKLFFYSEQPVSSVSSTNSDVFVCKIQEHVYAVTLSDREGGAFRKGYPERQAACRTLPTRFVRQGLVAFLVAAFQDYSEL